MPEDSTSPVPGAPWPSVPAPPADPSLPTLATCLAPGAVAEELRRHWAAAADLGPDNFKATYIRYKPGTLFHVVYSMPVSGVAGPETTPVVLTVYAGGRGLDTWRRKSFARLRQRGRRLGSATGRGGAVWLPGLQAILQAYPLDRKLPWLLDAATPSVAAVAMAAAGLPPPATEVDVEMVRYKPGRKALLLVSPPPSPSGRPGAQAAAYVKVDADGRGAAVLDLGVHLVAAGVATIQPVAYVTEHHMLCTRRAPGQSLRRHRGLEDYTTLMAPTARLLAQMHNLRCPPVMPGPSEYRHGAAAMQRAAAYLGRILPERRRQLENLTRALGTGLAEVPRKRSLVHGDFYDDQVLVGGQLSLLDLDEATAGHPLLDVGNFLAHLEAARLAGDAPGAGAAAAAFLEAYARLDATAPRLAPLFKAVGLVSLAVGPFRRLEAGWPWRVGALLDAAAAAAAEATAAGPRRGGWAAGESRAGPGESMGRGTSARASAAPVDPGLPQLEAILDTEALTSRLRGALGDPGLRVTSTTVVRHKPGRRALVRIALARTLETTPPWLRGPVAGSLLFGKTFASGRGPKVFEVHRCVAAGLEASKAKATPDVPMCAPPVAHLDDLKLLLQGAVGGRPFAAAMARGEARLGGAVARALWRFNRLDIDVGRSHGSGDELGALGRRVETWMAGDLPEAEARLAQKCLAAVAGGHASMAKWRYVPIHRDFYPDQLLVAGHRVCFLDLDDVAMSEPAVDVANFTAHMRLAALVRPEAAPATRRVAADFVAACAALDPGLDLALVRFLEGATLLRLAAIHGPRRGGRRLVIPLLRTAATALVPPLVPPLGLPDVALA